MTSSAINHTFRLLDAQSGKDALARSSAVLAVISSSWFFEEVIRHSEESDAAEYRPVEIVNKETTVPAWIRTLGTAAPVVLQRLRKSPIVSRAVRTMRNR